MRRLLLAAAAVAFALALFGVPHARGEGPPLRDFEAYYAAGSTWFYHGDVYGRDVWRAERLVPGVDASREEFLPFVGPAFGLPLWSALAGLPFRAASILWAVVLGLAVTVLALGSLRLAHGRLRRTPAVATLLFTGAFAPITGGVGLGQVAIVAAAAIVAFPLVQRTRGTFAAIVATLVAGLQPNLALALLARATDARARIALILATVFATFGAALALGGPDGLLRYATVLRDHGAAERFIAIQTTPGAVAYALGAPPAIAGAIGLALAASVTLALVLQCARGTYAPDVRLMLACAALPLAVPFAHEHDFVIAFLPALVVATRGRGAAWVWGTCAALALGIDWLGLAQRPQDVAAACAFAFAGACALAALAPERLGLRHAIPFAFVPTIAVLAPLAAAHRLPVWPDALPPGFHVAATAPAAAVWHAEQVSAGIAAPDPVVGALRAIALIACAVLWFVASRTLRVDHRSDA